jgi:signal transduction histidine kinase/PAS domain-containing protein
MSAAALPLNENQRLASLAALDLLDTSAEAEFDELVKAAALVCDMPVSLISLIDKDRQWFKANVGLEATAETPRESAFCAHAILGESPLEICDALADRRFADNPLVLGDPGIRFYAGFPLQLSDGSTIGTLCVIDRRPRELSSRQREILGHLARSVVSAMESRRQRRIADRAAGSRGAFESRWRNVFDHLHDGFILGEAVCDADERAVDWRYIDVNASWAEMVGVAQDDARGRTVREVFPGIEQGWVDEGLNVIGQQAPSLVERQIGPLGRWYEGRATWLGGKRFVISFRDVTQQRLAHRKREALLHLSDTLSAMPDEASMLQRSTELIGEMLGVDIAGYGTMMADGETLNVQCNWIKPGAPSTIGQYWLPQFGTHLDNLRKGRPVVADDVELDRSLYADACKTAGATSVVNIPVIEQGKLVAILFALDKRARSWSQSPEHIAFLQAVADRTRNAVERKSAQLELEQLTASLARQVTERTVELQSANAVLAAKVDALTVAEDALRQAQKMEAVGQLTGGIAHDFNNLLASISSSLQVLRLRLEKGDGGDLQRYIRMGMESVSRAATLTQRLLAFSKRQSLDPRPVDVNRLVAGMEDLIRGTVGPGIHLEVVGAGGLWPTLIDAAQLENSILNLCINARDAMAPHGGRLTIETANKWLDDRAAKARELAPGQYVSLSVTDTGAGMLPHVISRAFDPFFTTKPTGQGTGLGLSMVYGFVRQSGGQVRIYSELERGTTMCLYLPRFAGSVADETLTDVDLLPHADGSETVLVVEDENTIRQLVVEVLEGAGYRVITADTGAGALRLLDSGARVDLLLTDVGLPGGMNGRQIADAARVAMPSLAVIFMTGYAENAVVGNGVLDEGMAMITKPFEMAVLVNKVRVMLDETVL